MDIHSAGISRHGKPTGRGGCYRLLENISVARQAVAYLTDHEFDESIDMQACLLAYKYKNICSDFRIIHEYDMTMTLYAVFFFFQTIKQSSSLYLSISEAM